MSMDRLRKFVEKEGLYVLLVLFILFVNLVLLVPDQKSSAAKKTGLTVSATASEEDAFLKPEAVEKALQENKYLALLFSLASMLILATILLGLFIDGILLSYRFSNRSPDIRTFEHGPVKWNALDIGRVVVLFLFFGYSFVITEAGLARFFPILKEDNFRMVLNSSVLDVLAIVFIIYFVVGQYKEKLTSVGLSLKNFAKNVFYGITGYIATVPLLIAALVAITFLIKITGYVPEQQPVVELFFKEKNTAFLIYSGIFASVVGPIIEELFFRGFMYPAFKKYIGVFWSMVITAAIFASLHTNVVGFVPIMILGILLAYLYEKTGTLVAPAAVHMIHNLSMVFLVFLIKQIRV